MAANAWAQAGSNIAAVVRAETAGGEKAMKKLGIILVSDMKRILSEPGRGRVYVRRGRSHRASAPGDPPAVDTGKYRASWDWAVRQLGIVFELIVGTADKRGPWFEYGTSRMLPRPHLRPLVERMRAANLVGTTLGTAITEVAVEIVRRLPH